MTNGVFVTHTVFARGFDMKFASDSLVLVLDINGTLNWTDAC